MYCIARMGLGNDTLPIRAKSGTKMQTDFGFADIDGEITGDIIQGRVLEFS